MILPVHLAITFPAFTGDGDGDGHGHDHDDHDLHFLGGNLIIVTTTIITTSWDPEKHDAGRMSSKSGLLLTQALSRG